MVPQPQDPLSYMWEIPKLPQRSTLRWHWWFVIFVFDNPEDPLKPLQFMTLWSTKDVKDTLVNERLHTKKKSFVSTNNIDKFDGVAAAWYFDGTKNHHNIVLETVNILNHRTTNSGKIQLTGSRSTISMLPDPKGYVFQVENPDFTANLKMKLHPNHHYYGPLREEKYFLKGLMQQSTYKINQFNTEGTISHKGVTKKLTGRGYFQRIILNAPVPPWWWGVIFFDDGSMIKYFLPNVSLGIFRRGTQDKPYIWDSAFKAVKKELDFYDSTTDRVESFKKARVYKSFKENGLPIFKFHWTRPDGGNLSFTLDTYARSLFSLRTKAFGTLLKTTLNYNEYPCTVTQFEMKIPKRKISKKDLGKGLGNCEHSWGILS
ncbi:MAG: hypothetical protein ACXACA_03520 [Candidatus Ranarchaeia archaeon]|jgi:hypothetical protein